MYPPLKYIDTLQKKNLYLDYSKLKKVFGNLGVRLTFTEDEFIDFILSDKCLQYNNKYKDINSVLLSTFEAVVQSMGEGAREEFSYVAETRDNFLFPIILDKWSRFKQVYKPDNDFAACLIKTQNLSISYSMIEHIPTNLFYIDTSDCEIFGDIDGIFTYVHKRPTDVIFNVFLLVNNEMYSFYIGGPVNDLGMIDINFDKLRDFERNYDSIIVENGKLIHNTNINENRLDRKTVSLFALQMIAYLSMEQPQITESDLTKNTYVPKSPMAKVRNKWSEVKIEDVGIKYGADFRKTIKEYNNTTTIKKDSNKRNSPIPHFRSAHWHKYWVGKGRKELRVKWIEPIFVGNGKSNNVIIHKVKNET